MSARRAPTSSEPPAFPYVRLECGFCGQKGGAYVGHYDIIRCDCGVAFWALRPTREDSLQFFPWPGRDLDEAVTIRARWVIRGRTGS